VGWQNTQDAVRQLRAGQGFIGHAHSMPLELLSSMGAPGFLAYGFWWVAAFLVFRRLTADPGLARMGLTFRAMAAASIAFLINGLTQVNFWDGKVLHQLMWTMGLALAFSSLSRMPEEARS
jgi:O-antigen ligase